MSNYWKKGKLNKWLISGGKRKKDAKFDNTICEELKKGLTGYQIAKKYKWNKKTVYNHIKSRGVIKKAKHIGL